MRARHRLSVGALLFLVPACAVGAPRLTGPGEWWLGECDFDWYGLDASARFVERDGVTLVELEFLNPGPEPRWWPEARSADSRRTLKVASWAGEDREGSPFRGRRGQARAHARGRELKPPTAEQLQDWWMPVGARVKLLVPSPYSGALEASERSPRLRSLRLAVPLFLPSLEPPRLWPQDSEGLQLEWSRATRRCAAHGLGPAQSP